MPGISIPEFNRESAIKALGDLLQNVSPSGEIEIKGVFKTVTEIKTTQDQTRTVLDSDFDRLAVLTGIVKAIGEENLEAGDVKKYIRLLEAARNSEAFRDLNHSERRTINSAYRALAFQENKIPWIAKLGDFFDQLMLDFHSRSSEIPLTEREKIENVLQNFLPHGKPSEAERTSPLFAVKARIQLSQLLVSATEDKGVVFGITDPSSATRAFAKLVKKKTEEVQRLLEEEIQREQQSRKPSQEKESVTASPKELTEWLRKNATAMQDDVLQVLTEKPDYKEFCRLVKSALVSAYTDYQNLLKNASRLTPSEFVEQEAAIEARITYYTDQKPSRKETGKDGKPLVCLRRWLIDQGVEDLKDPRHIFLDGFKDLFLSLKKETYNVIKKMPGWVGGTQAPWPAVLAEEAEEEEEEEPEEEVVINQLPEELEEFQPGEDDYSEFLKWIKQNHSAQTSKLRAMTKACEKMTQPEVERTLSIVYGIYRLLSSKRSEKVTDNMVQKFLRGQLESLPEKFTTPGWEGFAKACSELFNPIIDECGSQPPQSLAVALLNPKPKAK
jgi:hypothetical protein